MLSLSFPPPGASSLGEAEGAAGPPRPQSSRDRRRPRRGGRSGKANLTMEKLKAPKTLTRDEIQNLLAARVTAAGDAARFAKMHGLTVLHVANVLRGARLPCMDLSRALGLRMVTRYILDPQAARGESAAI